MHKRSPCFTPMWVTVAVFLGGASLFAVGSHLSYVHVAPQQARIQARSDYVRARLKKKYGYDKFTEMNNMYIGPRKDKST